MAYLGRGLDKISNIEVLDNITFDGSSSYSITKNSVAFVGNSAQSFLISIDGIVNAANFTVNGSTIDFGVAVPSTSVCNFFLHYGTGVMTVPSDGSVTTAKLGNSAVDLTSKVTGALPVANGGTNLTSGFANGITMADQFRLSADVGASSQSVDFTSNLERVDTSGQGTLGSSLMSESSGIFTFPSTGIYLVRFDLVSYVATATRYLNAHIMLTTNNSSYSIIAEGRNGGFVSESSSTNNQANAITLLDITDTSNQKVKFQAVINQTSSNGFYGSSTLNRTTMTFIRLGDT